MSEEGTTRAGSPSQKQAKLANDASLDGLGNEDGKEQQPYTSSLDFLDDYFQQITEQIKLSRERLKREMKEVIGDDDVAPWEREGRVRAVLHNQNNTTPFATLPVSHHACWRR